MSRKKSARSKAYARDIGEVIADKYKILNVLGQGGFGTVYLVEITAGMIGQRLALKVLSDEFSGNDVVRDQFLNEIRVTMKMVDRYIVQIRDVGTTSDGRVYYTMDFCQGKTLLKILREEGQLSCRRTILIILKVLHALRTAHSRGIIHRDLKPANIMVETQNGRDSVRVLDFGIATVLREPQSDTEKRVVSGSPLYMPPEQFLGEQLGFYTDLYAVGAILYECLTGKKPYPGRSAKEVFDALKRGPPTPPETLNPGLGDFPGLSETVMKALERNPERRFQTSRELFDELGAFLNEDGAAETSARARANGRAGAGVGRRPTGLRTAGRPAHRRPGRRRKGLGIGPWVLLFLVVIGAGVVAYVLRDRLGLAGLENLLPSPVRSESAASESPPRPSDAGGPPREAIAPTISPEVPTTPESTKAVIADTRGERSEDGSTKTTPRDKPNVEKRGPDLNELLVTAVEAFGERDWDDVLELAGEVIEHESSNARALRLLGETHAQLGQLEDAERYLEKARGRSLDDPTLLLELARVKTRKKPPEWAAAERLLESALALEEGRDSYKNQEISSLLAEALKKQNKRKKLVRLLVKAKEQERDFPEFATHWQELLVDAPARLWAEAKKAGDSARGAYEGNELDAAMQSATQAIRFAGELDEFGEHAPRGTTRRGARTLALEMRILSAVIAIDHPKIAGLDKAAIARLLDPVSRAVKKSREAAPALVMKWNYLSGRLELPPYGAKSKKTALDAAESYLNQARRIAQNEDRRHRDADFLAAIHSWLARVYAHRADYARVSDHLKNARDVKDLGKIYEQARTYFLTGTKTRAKQRIDSYQSAADRLENITNLPRTRVPPELYASSLDLLGQCYLMLGRYEEKQRRFVYAANKFVEARSEGRRTPELYRNLGAAYEAFNQIKAAQTYRELYEQIQPSVCNCLLAAEMFVRATENAREAHNLVNDGLNRFDGKKRKALERALRAIEAARSKKIDDKLARELEKLRRISCK